MAAGLIPLEKETMRVSSIHSTDMSQIGADGVVGRIGIHPVAIYRLPRRNNGWLQSGQFDHALALRWLKRSSHGRTHWWVSRKRLTTQAQSDAEWLRARTKDLVGYRNPRHHQAENPSLLVSCSYRLGSGGGVDPCLSQGLVLSRSSLKARRQTVFDGAAMVTSDKQGGRGQETTEHEIAMDALIRSSESKEARILYETIKVPVFWRRRGISRTGPLNCVLTEEK